MPVSRVLGGGLVAGVLAAAVLFNAGSPAPVRVTRVQLRRHDRVRIHRQRDDGSYESTNWSGYAVTGPQGSATDVKGSWTVPNVTCGGTPTGYSSFWVGLDGWSSNTVEQIGTDSDCVSLNGSKTDTPTYYAWFEFYPKGSYLIEFSRGVHPGDSISAEVKYAGSSSRSGRGGGENFTVTITDVTQNESYSTTSSVSGAQQTSAEWIAEAPCCLSSGSVLPLADFGTVFFSSGAATMQGVAKAIGAFGANVQEVTMVGENAPNATKALPSALSSSGSAFSDAWVSAGP